MRACTLASLLLAATVAAGAQASLTIAPGVDGQTTRVGATVPVPVQFIVRDDAGRPVANQFVGVSTTSPIFGGSPEGFEYGFSATSDAQGVAQLPIMMGYSVGTATFTVLAGGYGSAKFQLTVNDAPELARLVALTDTQRAVRAASTDAQPLRVQALDTTGRAVEYAVVTFAQVVGPVDSGTYPVAASFDGEASVTVAADGNGIATAPPVTLGIAKSSGGGSPITIIQARSTRFDPVQTQFLYAVQAGGRGNLQDLWWGGIAENGWGLSVIEHPSVIAGQPPILFVVLFIYDADGIPTWYAVSNGSWTRPGPSATQVYGTAWQGLLIKPSGPPFHDYSGPHQERYVGQATLKFIGDSGIKLEYAITNESPTVNGAGTKFLQRFDYSNSMPSPRQQVSDLWWGGIAQDGWGISVHEDPGALFSLWFTYGDDRQPTWFVMSDGSWVDGDTFAGPIFKPFGSKWIGAVYDPAQHREEQVGNYALRFGPGTPPDRATFRYSVGPYGGVLDLSRLGF
jgi:hypothetical protein